MIELASMAVRGPVIRTDAFRGEVVTRMCHRCSSEGGSADMGAFPRRQREMMKPVLEKR